MRVVTGHQQQANTTASASPPPTTQASPLTPEEQHRELDELLSDMMLTVQSIPDYKPTDDITFIDEEDKNIPYHARQDSRPFSYGVNSTMIGDSKKLSSPSLVRKASFNKSSGDTLKKVQTQVYPDLPILSKPITDKYNTYSSSTISTNTNGTYKNGRARDEIDNIFTDSALASSPTGYSRQFHEEYYKDERKRYDPLKRSFTEGTIRRSPEKASVDVYKKAVSSVSSPYSDSESLSPPGAFRNQTKSPEFHET